MIFKTIFRFRYGYYEFIVMFFGLINVFAVFMELMNMVFKDFLDIYAIVFIDDILVYFKAEAEYEEYLYQVFEIFRVNRLYVKFFKCEFWMKQVLFFGYVVFSEGFSVDSVKIEVVINWFRFSTISEVRSFLGLVGYYRRFVEGFFHIVSFLI